MLNSGTRPSGDEGKTFSGKASEPVFFRRFLLAPYWRNAMARAAARINCLDASALIKLVLPEPRSEKLRAYLASESGWYTTPFCFYEALSVLKVKYIYKHKITEDEYHKATFDLMAAFRGGAQHIPDLDLTNALTFSETLKLCKTHDVDLSDAFQIMSIIKGCPFAGHSN